MKRNQLWTQTNLTEHEKLWFKLSTWKSHILLKCEHSVISVFVRFLSLLTYLTAAAQVSLIFLLIWCPRLRYLHVKVKTFLQPFLRTAWCAFLLVKQNSHNQISSNSNLTLWTACVCTTTHMHILSARSSLLKTKHFASQMLSIHLFIYALI